MASRTWIVAGALALGACIDSPSGGADAALDAPHGDAPRGDAARDAPPGDASDACAGVLAGLEADEAGLYVFMDTLADAGRPPPIARVGFENSCWAEHDRGQWLSTWLVTTTTHQVFIDIDGVQRFTASVPYGDLDLKLWAIDDTDPSMVVSFADRSTEVPAGWKLHLANLSGAPIDIYQLPGPGQDEVAVAIGLPHGAGVVSDLAVDPGRGARIRVVRDGVELYRGRAGFWTCDPGAYLPGIHAFVAMVEAGRNSAAMAWAANVDGVLCEGDDPTPTRLHNADQPSSSREISAATRAAR